MKATNPYLRLARVNRPIGVWLLLFPCFWGWGLALSHKVTQNELLYLPLFAIGALLMRSAGCVYNDIVDRDYDAKVKRTASRPLAEGSLSLKQAWIFLSLLLSLAFIVLLQFHPFTIFLGIASLSLVAIYPWMKRFTYWPQAFLGLAFNWGALMGWSSIKEDIELPTLLLYGAGFFWTLAYDTIYAHQDKEDDLLVGVKSSALALGDKTKPFLVLFYSLTLILLVLSNPKPIFYLALIPTAFHFFWQTWTVDLNDPDDCLKKFKSNQWVGGLILLAILLGAL